MQTTSDCHNEVADSVLPIPHFLLNDPAALHTGYCVLDPYFLTGDALVLGLLRVRELATAWSLGRLLHLDTCDGKALEAHVLIQDAAAW